MRIHILVLSLLCVFSSCVSTTYAEIILTVGTGSFTENSGIQTVDIFARSTSLPVDATQVLTADFRLAAGNFPTVAGTFGGSLFIGENNIVLPPASGFVSAGNAEAALSLEFSLSQMFPSMDMLLARMNIDTTGVAQGTYDILVTRVSSGATAISAVNGSFTITAVPEPSSLAFLSLVSGVAFRRRPRPS